MERAEQVSPKAHDPRKDDLIGRTRQHHFFATVEFLLSRTFLDAPETRKTRDHVNRTAR